MVGDQPTPPSLHRCKVCFKSFPCGRSLGGHMRSHVNKVAAAAGDERAQSSYGLRENPKKTWRASDSGYGDGKKCCAECGKEFLTWRALFGHMKCHPGRPQPPRHKPAGDMEELEMQSDHEITLSVPHRKKRTVRLPVAASCSLSGTDDERGEDGAISLMMLSRGSRYWSTGGGGSSESSVKNSPVLEDAKGSELDDARNEFRKTESDASNDLDGFGDCVEELGNSCAEDNDLNSRAAGEIGIESPPIKIDLEVIETSGADVIETSGADESKSLADHVAGSPCDDPKPNAGEKRRRFECAACKKTFKSYQALGGHRASHKRMKCCPGSSTSTANASTGPIATEQWASAAHRSDDVSESSFGLAKKNKEHKCLICGKVFSSGQALGGHKRCHLFKSPDGEDNAASDAMLRQQPPRLEEFIDLNLPATAGDDGDFYSINSEENSELESWWIGGIVEHEGVQIGVISN